MSARARRKETLTFNNYNAQSPKNYRIVPAVMYREETKPTNCPLCGRNMSIVNDLKDFSIQFCYTHGIYGVDKATNDTWVLEGFDGNMAPIKRKWYTIENHKPLTIDQYRDMVKWANLKRLEDK